MTDSNLREKLVETQPQALPVPSQASPVAFPLTSPRWPSTADDASHSYHTHSKNPLMLPMVATPKRESDTDRNGSTHQRTHRYPHLARLEPTCLEVQVHAKEFDQFPLYLTVKWRNHTRQNSIVDQILDSDVDLGSSYGWLLGATI